ncbi:DUF2863 family protein [Azospira sp. APE16]|uniref:DUF2863 family protein n=1 Tax=Azospira sp. APE16 TaxID=3394231 RepID=UPI003A4D4742
MKRPRFGSRSRVSRDVSQLSWLATGLAESGGKLEDAFWEARLAALVEQLLADGNEEELTAALDRLYETNAQAHDELADMVESRAESCLISHQGQDYDVLLVAAPVLAWSRFGIPTANIPADTLAALKAQLCGHVLAAEARVAVVDFLFSPDQLPRSYSDTYRLTNELGRCALAVQDMALDTREMPETNRFLSDTRYLLAAIAVPRHSPLFYWHEVEGNREVARQQWRQQGGAALEPLLTGCAYEALLPDAYHAACRQADKDSRPYSLRASVAFLQTVMGVEPASLRVAIGPFHDQRLEEYRLGFSLQSQADKVIHGVVWALIGTEDENSESVAEMEAVLRECGVTDIVVHDHRFPFEFCDDCGAPLYPNGEGELMHTEMPEEQAEQPPRLLH